MGSNSLLEEKTVLFRRYKELTINQQNSLKKGDVENVQKLVDEKEAIKKQIQELDTKLQKEENDQSSLEPLIKEVLELEERMTADAAQQKTGLTTESGNLRKSKSAIKKYLQ